MKVFAIEEDNRLAQVADRVQGVPAVPVNLAEKFPNVSLTEVHLKPNSTKIKNIEEFKSSVELN
jgi:hypothetical protein